MKLGLIGKNIQKSRSPELHIWLGEKNSIETTYDLFDCTLSNKEELFNLLLKLKKEGYQGVNITFPYKIWAWDVVDNKTNIDRTLGSLNTVILSQDKFIGTNTDCTGFKRAYQTHFKTTEPKKVLLKGAGGVGRAIAFGLAQLNVECIYIYDVYEDVQENLVKDLQEIGVSAIGVSKEDIPIYAVECEGLINATPIGHYATPGQSFFEEEIHTPKWIFDAVYTPVETEFVQLAKKKNAEIISGYELFIHQGIDAYEAFTMKEVDSSDIYKAIPINN